MDQEKGLRIPDEFDRAFPAVATGIKELYRIHYSIRSFEDIEQIFLKGSGLSVHTYRSYLTAVKQLFDFTGALHPYQVEPRHIEEFYDHLVESSVDRNTARLRIAGLKKFFGRIGKVLPIPYTSPFERMDDQLKKKLGKGKKGNRTKAALSRGELQAVLDYLRNFEGLKGKQNYALVLTLATTGLRAFELCQLKWEDLHSLKDGRIVAHFEGKGGKDAEQEIYPEALAAGREAYEIQFGKLSAGRWPKGPIFYCTESYKGKPATGMNEATLWTRLHAVGGELKAKGLIRKDLQFSAHLFRRTFATLLFKAGMDIRAVQGATRHTSIETLAKHYLDSVESTAPYFDKILALDNGQQITPEANPVEQEEPKQKGSLD